ncbi:hypothetical protein GCM10010232_54580 [Streptomyces amakusaensis]|uniref:ATP-binding cassette domain-containing protein n=1 Tax=Streptomyces amakusaensis TaxID=67271 RepID=UPI0031D8AC37
MLQAIGLTSAPRRDLPPAVHDLTFDAPPGRVTALLGAPGSGKSTALRLMLGIEPGRGETYFRGSPLHRVAHPAREVGALLGDVPGHPARTVRGHLRMLCAAVGAPPARADEVLDATGIAGLAHRRLDTLSLGADRRLGAACALLGDPHTLILDQPAAGLPPAELQWWHGLLRAHADRGGTVLCTTDDPGDAPRFADRVVTVEAGRLVADQTAGEFARTRRRPRVAVRTPHAARLADLVRREARAARRPVEAVTEGGGLLSVYGSSCAEVGETAFRHRVPVHLLADEPGTPAPAPAPAGPPPPPAPRPGPAALPAPAPPGPPRPLRYELLRLLGVRTAALIAAAAVAASPVCCVLLARSRGTDLTTALAAWPDLLPLPPAAFGAGVIGALSFGEEFRHPALAAALGTTPRRAGPLTAKLAVTAAVALLVAVLAAAAGAWALRLVYGSEAAGLPDGWPALLAGWCALSVGCAWAGLLAAGVFRLTAAGVAAVLAVPVLVAPLVRGVLAVPSARPAAGLPGRLRELAWPRLPRQADDWLSAGVHAFAQPVGVALMLSLSVLICAYMFIGRRRGTPW